MKKFIVYLFAYLIVIPAYLILLAIKELSEYGSEAISDFDKNILAKYK